MTLLNFTRAATNKQTNNKTTIKQQQQNNYIYIKELKINIEKNIPNKIDIKENISEER